ncbi:MAG: peptidase, partial [Candidatus Saccharibacteria bacterium]|nr:peptidase [Pseudorhodobacter sp.]
EHDCFSDNTHNSFYYDGLGIQNVYLGHYTRTDGTVITGPALSDLVAAADPAVDAQLKSELAATMAALTALKARADTGMAYDQMIAPGNAEGGALIMGTVDALVTQTASIQRAMGALGLAAAGFEGSDSLDNPTAVFQ